MSPSTLCRILLCLAMIPGLGGPLHAQDPEGGPPPGRIEGVVFDSILGEPLPDAGVFLWGTSHRAATDEDGSFVLTGIPPGAYTLLYYHARLGDLGISPGPTEVTLRPGQVLRVELGTPSWFTVVTSQCLLEDRDPGTGTLAGWVVDGSSGMGLPQAKVTLSWPVGGSTQPMRMEVETDADGWYRLCTAPADLPLTVSARFLNLEGLRREVSVPEGGSAEAAFLLWSLEPASVSGAVHDAASGAGVEGAEVWLRGTSFRTLTNRDGAFRLGNVPPGTYTFLAEHLAYGTQQDTLVVPSGRTLAVDMRLGARAIELEPLTVTVENAPVPRRAGGGLTINRDQIERLSSRGLRDAADVIQALNLPGVIVRRRGDGSLCVGFGPGQSRMMSFGSCVSMEVYINDVHATSLDMALHIPPEAVERIVLYRPVEAGSLFPINSANGVMVIYTRR